MTLVPDLNGHRWTLDGVWLRYGFFGLFFEDFFYLLGSRYFF